MLSLELTRKLSAAGLLWIPQDGDQYYYRGGISVWSDQCDYEFALESEIEQRNKSAVWIPPLSQLLAEIEARGYEWEAGVSYTEGGPMMPGRQKSGYWCEVWKGGKRIAYGRRDTPEEAAGLALLWILEQEGKA